jgi:hypothetical protein
MNADTGRYARITHRLATAVSSEEDDASRELAGVLERRIVESIAVDCAPFVTSDLMSERLMQAVGALAEHDVLLRVGDTAVKIERCFCQLDACEHPSALLGRLLCVAVESIITHEGRRALGPVGAFGRPGYTKRASMNAPRLRS